MTQYKKHLSALIPIAKQEKNPVLGGLNGLEVLRLHCFSLAVHCPKGYSPLLGVRVGLGDRAVQFDSQLDDV